jgi:predicted MFS family arabinose efflux permease
MGQILGVPMGKMLGHFFGFHWAFMAFGLVMVMAFFLIHYKVPQPNVRLSEGPITFFGSLKRYGVLLSRSSVRAAAAAHLMMFLAMSVYIVFLPTWLETEFEVSWVGIALLFGTGGVANVLTGPQAGKLSDMIGRKGLILISCAGFAAIMIATTFVMKAFWVAYPLFFLTMILIAMRISPMQALTTALVPDNRRGATMSLMMAIGQMGYGIGGSISGPAFAYYGFFSNTLIGAVFILAMGFTVWKFIPEPRMRPVQERENEEAA